MTVLTASSRESALISEYPPRVASAGASDTPSLVTVFLGPSGEPGSILAVAANFGVAVNRVELPGGDYTMDHSAVVFLLDARARIAAIFTPPFEVAALAADLRRAAPYLEVRDARSAT